MPDVCCSEYDEVDHRRQHQDAAERRVEEELDRRVDPPLAPPDADDEEHRDQHRFPEEVEDEEILRDERAQHRELDQEHHRVEELDVLRDRRECAGDDQRAQERGQRDQQDAHPVDADVVVDAPVGNPRDPGLELQPRRGGVEMRVEHRGEHELQRHHGERHAPHERVVVARHEDQDRDAGERQVKDDRQECRVSHGGIPRRDRRSLRSPRRTRSAAGCRSGRATAPPRRAARGARAR